MAPLVPQTSTTLLRDLTDAQSARWVEFFTRYVPMMEAYLASRFPNLEADDLIQDTLAALVEKLPDYRYSPEETGHFRNYLTGILRHKALKAVERSARQREHFAELATDTDRTPDSAEDERRVWRESVFEIALGQLLADESVKGRTREVFVRVAVNGEDPAAVAAAYGIERHAVDQIKSRMVGRLKELVGRLEAVGEHA